MSVRALLRNKSTEVVSASPTAEVRAVARLLVEHRIGGAAIVDGDGALVGFVSEADLVKAIDSPVSSVRDIPVRSIMRRPAPTCRADDALQEVMERMTRDRLRHLVVMEGDAIAAVISVGDLVKHRLGELETETGVLRDYIAGQRAIL